MSQVDQGLSPSQKRWRMLRRDPSVIFGSLVLTGMLFMALCAPWLGTTDPTEINPIYRNKKPGTVATLYSAEGEEMPWVFRMGSDQLGRDIYSRVVYGTRISLITGFSVALLSVFIGLIIGLISGYFKRLDGVIMRIMDGLMAIPAILLAIALVSLWGASLMTVILAITIPEMPRVVRLVRSVVLSVREHVYVQAAEALGANPGRMMIKHIMPSTFAPLIVQGTYACAAAVLLEAILSFLGVGIPPETPTWGNIMAEGRRFFRVYPYPIFYPGLFLALTVLAVNMLGDGLRDSLDPRLQRNVGN